MEGAIDNDEEMTSASILKDHFLKGRVLKN